MNNTINVLFDGKCTLCLGSVRWLKRFDWLKVLSYHDFQHEHVRTNIAPSITYETLDKAMHIQLQDKSYLNGFSAFRYILWHLPALCIITPLLYIPGIPYIGNRVYAYIAHKRKDCTHETCAL